MPHVVLMDQMRHVQFDVRIPRLYYIFFHMFQVLHMNHNQLIFMASWNAGCKLRCSQASLYSFESGMFLM